tara:strand:- start:42 stop:203 length:162 start_codon:yes stop_codon:yes gene_type:complete
MNPDKSRRHPWKRMACDNRKIREKAYRESVTGMVIRKEISAEEGKRRLKERNA